MTNKEVINFLNQVRKILLDDKSWLESTIQPINEAFDMAINALTAQPERDIPLDCIIDDDGNAICPKCGANAEWHKYCEECGQALKWREE